MKSIDALIESLKQFNDRKIRAYTRFASEWRDQRLADGAGAEAAFWNAIVSLCIEERQRRAAEIRRLEYMYRTGRDPDASGTEDFRTLRRSSPSSVPVRKRAPRDSPSERQDPYP